MTPDINAARILVPLAALVLCSCATPTESIPPVPALSLAGVDPEVEDAVRQAHRNAEAEPDNADASGRLGMVLQANTLYPQAVQAYERAIQLDPDQFEWRYYLALTLREQSELERAADTLSAALKLRPDYAPGSVKLGELLFELGRLEESNTTLAAALEEFPDSAEGLYDLARVKSSQGDTAAAEDLYRRAVLQDPAFGAAYFGLATTQRSLGKTSEAERNFDLAERYTGNEPQEDPLFGEVLELGTGALSRIQKAQRLVLEGDAAQASQLFLDVLEDDPDNLNGLLNILYLGQVNGQPTAAEMKAFYDQARQIAPGNPQVYLFYAMTLTNANQLDTAIATVNKAIALRPDYAEAETLLGTILAQQNRHAQAIDHYRAALKAQPTYRPARMQLAQSLINTGSYQGAIPELRSLLEVDDANTALTMLFLAQAYAKTGDAGKALEYLRHAQTRAKRTGPPELLAEIEQGMQQLGARP